MQIILEICMSLLNHVLLLVPRTEDVEHQVGDNWPNCIIVSGPIYFSRQKSFRELIELLSSYSDLWRNQVGV